MMKRAERVERAARRPLSVAARVRVAVVSLIGAATVGAMIAGAALMRVAAATSNSMSERLHEEVPLLAISEDLTDFAREASVALMQRTSTVRAAAASLAPAAERVSADFSALSSASMDDPRELAHFESARTSWREALALLDGAGRSEVAGGSSTRVIAFFSVLDDAADSVDHAHDIALDEVGEHFAAALHTRDVALALVAITTLACGTLVLFAGRQLTRSIVPPTRALGDAAARFAEGDFETPVAENGPAELFSVARGLNAMAVKVRSREADLLYRSFHDPLTDLGNRYLLEERLTGALARRTSGAIGAVSLVVIDLDDFKRVNDSLGHACGDMVIKTAAERLLSCIRDEDTVCRLGGDEFAVVLEGSRSHTGEIAGRVAAALSEPFRISGQSITITASFGVSTARDSRTDADQMLRDASLAIEAAKSGGGNRIERFEPEMHDEAVERLALESDLRAALRRDEFAVHYQPVVDLRTNEISGVEALVRWNHPALGFLLPGRFIEMAEQTGLVIELGYLVMAAACAEVKSWIDECDKRSEFSVAVNVSARQVVQSDFVDRVIRTLDSAGLPPRNLVIEITERVIVAELAEARDKLTRLREMGVRIALDDFGTGFTSLQYLQSLPVDIIKIDRCFIDGVARRADLEVIVRSVLSLATGLGYEVIAEGVESDEDAQVLRSLGCAEAQGFGLHRPGPSSMIRALLHCDIVSEQNRKRAAGVEAPSTVGSLGDDGDLVA